MSQFSLTVQIACHGVGNSRAAELELYDAGHSPLNSSNSNDEGFELCAEAYMFHRSLGLQEMSPKKKAAASREVTSSGDCYKVDMQGEEDL